MLNCTSALGTDFRATTTTDITLMGTIIRTALTPTISHTIAPTIGLIIGTGATVTTTTTVITITITIGATKGTRGIRTNNKALTVATMCVSNEDCSPARV